MKKLLSTILILAGLFFGVVASAAPDFSTTRTLLPEVNDTYYLGTPTRAYKGISVGTATTSNLIVTGTCVGCGSTWATTSTDYWYTLQNKFATTSVDYWKTVTDFFSTTSTNHWATQYTGALTAGTISVPDYLTIEDGTSNKNTKLGYTAGNQLIAGAEYNTYLGYQAGALVIAGQANTQDYNTAVGYQSGFYNKSGANNTSLGTYSLYSNGIGASGSNNTAIGFSALDNLTTGDGNVALGYGAGRFAQGSNQFYLNNVLQSTYANDKAYSLLYGTFAGTAGTLAGQQLTVNASTTINGTTTVGTMLFDQAPLASAFQSGKLYYDTTYKTLSLNTGRDTTLQIGQETWVRGINSSGVTIPNGSAVYISGASGVFPTFALAKADSIDTYYVAGIATQEILNGAEGFVTVRGVVNDLNTSAYSAGTNLFLSTTTAGGYTSIQPSSLAVRVGRVIVSNATTGSIYSNPQFVQNTTAVTGSNVTMYHWNGASDVATYEAFRTYPDTVNPAVDETCSADADIAGGYCSIDSYVSTTTDLAITSIPAGTWNFDYYTYVNSATGISKIEATVFRRTSAGTETQLFQATSTEINDTAVANKAFQTSQGAFAFDASDRLVVKVKGWTNQSTAKTIHFLYGGMTSTYSRVETPISIGNFNFARLDTPNTFTSPNTFSATTTISAIELTGADTGIKFQDGTYLYTAPTSGSSWATTSTDYWATQYTGDLTAGTLSVPNYINFDDTDNNTRLGHIAGSVTSSGSQHNTYMGSYAGGGAVKTDDADYNTAIGSNSQYSLTTGSGNTSLGYLALKTNEVGTNNTAVGRIALYANTGNANVALGAYAGRHETGDNSLYIDNQERGDEATGKTNSLIYGTFNADPSLQKLTINAKLGISTTAPASLLTIDDSIGNWENGGGIAFWSTGTNPYHLYHDGSDLVLYTGGAGGQFKIESDIGQTSIQDGTVTTGTTSSSITDAGILTATTIDVPSYLKLNLSAQNTFVGYDAGTNSTGNNNTYLGYSAGYSTGATTGNYNVAVGREALGANQEGNYSTALGAYSLNKSATNGGNTGVGYYTLGSLTSGYSNVAVGNSSMSANVDGYWNTAIGNNSLFANTGGIYNVSLGGQSLYSNVTGSSNIALGYASGRYETGSNSFYLNNIDQTDTAGDKAYSLLYGTFGGTAGTIAGNMLNVNGLFKINDKKVSARWKDGTGWSYPTTTDEVLKFGNCLEPGGSSVTVDKVAGIIASTTFQGAENTEGIAFNINIASSFASSAPMTMLDSTFYLNSTSTQQIATGFTTATIPAGYCWWISPVSASGTLIVGANVNLYGYED